MVKPARRESEREGKVIDAVIIQCFDFGLSSNFITLAMDPPVCVMTLVALSWNAA